MSFVLVYSMCMSFTFTDEPTCIIQKRHKLYDFEYKNKAECQQQVLPLNNEIINGYWKVAVKEGNADQIESISPIVFCISDKEARARNI